MADDVRQWQALRGMGLKAFWLFLMQGAAVRSVCGFGICLGCFGSTLNSAIGSKLPRIRLIGF